MTMISQPETMMPANTEPSASRTDKGVGCGHFVRHFRCIVADPPWHYPHGYGRGPNGQLPYPTMSLGEIMALPVSDLADQSAHLYLWTTSEHLRYAFSVIGAWGFAYRGTMVWCKPGLGMGGSYRTNHEIIVIGERGKHEPKRRDVGTWHLWKNQRPHSSKPEEFYKLVESVSYGPYLELFARRKRPGWSVWGNEVESDICMPNAKLCQQGADTTKEL